MRFLCILTIATYVTIHSFGMSQEWFPADDVAELAFVNGIDSVARLFGSDVFGLFRPIKNLIFLLFSVLSPNVKLCRLVALLIGVLSYFPVRALFRRILICDWQAALCAAIWLLAPTLVSSVAWLSCVNIQLMCAFAALALCLHDRESVRDRMLAALFLFLALVSYENAVVIGPIAVAFDFFLRPRRLRKCSSWAAYGTYAAVTLVYLALRHIVGSGASVCGSFDAVSRLEMCLASAYFTWQHFLSWLWPFGRFAVFGGYRVGDVPVGMLICCWAGIVLLAVLAILVRRSFPVIAFGLAMALLGFVPVSNLAGLGNGPYGDYYLGLSSMGFALVVAEGVERARAPGACWRPLGLVVASALIAWRAGAALLSAQWAALWGDGEAAYVESARDFPGFFGNWQKLAEIRCNAGDWQGVQEACDRLDRLLSPKSHQRVTVYHVRALRSVIRDKQADAAMEFIEKAKSVARAGTFEHHYHYVRGCVFEDLLGDQGKAFDEYRLSLEHRFDCDGVDVANRLARLMAMKGKVKDAVALWRRALVIAPENPVVRRNLETACHPLP